MKSTLQLEPGKVIGGVYRVIRPLSEGGMGAVYVAEQTTTKKERALKVMRAELVTSTKMRERFVQEAQVGSRIESEHVIDVIDAGIDAETGTPWLAMELLKGMTLAKRIERDGPMSPSVARELFAQLCHALGAAHRVGIVHRDLKPDNIFLAESRREDVSFTLKVLDFGIAKLMSEVDTRSTAAIGTPLFMPPEQMVPGGTITPGADVWAIGLIVFYVLTGRPYWHAGNSEASSAMMLLNEVTNLPIEAPSKRLAQLDADVALPDGFDDWFLKCVNRVVEFRFKDASELRVELDAVLAEAAGPTSAHPAIRKRRSKADLTSIEGPTAPVRIESGTIAAEPLEPSSIGGASSAKGKTDFVAQRTTVPTTGLSPPVRWGVGLAVVAAIAVLAIVVLRSSPPQGSPAASGPSTATAADSPGTSAPMRSATPNPGVPAGSGASALRSSSSGSSTTMDSLLSIAEFDLQAAHDKILTLPAGSPELDDPRTDAIVERWVKDIFAKSAEGKEILARRKLLTRIVNDPLADDSARQGAFDRLLAIEPRTVTNETRHYVIVEPGEDTSEELAPYGRVAIVTELATRKDVVIASPAATAYDADRIVAENKLRSVLLRYDIKATYDKNGLKVSVVGNFFAHPQMTPLSQEPHTETAPSILDKDVSAERDLALIGAQRVAMTLAKAKTPATGGVQKNGKLNDKPKAPCQCAAGDPLCDCL